MKRLSLLSYLPAIFFSALTTQSAFADGFDRGGFDRGGFDRGGYDRGGSDRGASDRGNSDRNVWDRRPGYCEQKLDHLRYAANNFSRAADRLNEATAFICHGDLACIRNYQQQYASAKTELDQALQQ